MRKFIFSLLFIISFKAETDGLKVLNFVTGPDYAPLVDESDPKGGLATDILRRALAKEGYELNVKFQPWIRGLEGTRTGKFDGTYPYVKSSDRVEHFYFSDLLYLATSKIFVAKGRYQSVDQIKGRTVCIPLGYDDRRMSNFVQRYQLKIVRPPSLTSCFEMLHLKRVDSVGISELVGWATILQRFKTKNDFEALDVTIQPVQYYVMVSKAHPHGKEIIAIVNKALKKLDDKDRGLTKSSQK